MNKHLIVVVAILVMMLLASATASAGRDSLKRDLRDARAATADFRDIDVAIDAGYNFELHDAADIACIDNPPDGGMGIHHVNVTLLGNAAVNATTPEVLVYEPRKNGKMRLVALEYVVFQAAWGSSTPPSLFGQDFALVGVGNRYGLDPFYELHVWLWEQNPSGMFEDWNPRVSCTYAP